MTRIALTLLFALACGGLPRPAVSAPLLVAQWEFDGNWNASNDPSYDLTPGGGAQLVPSPSGMAAAFGGGTFVGPNNPAEDRADSAAMPTSASFNGGLSIVAFVKPITLVPGLAGGNILAHDISGDCCGALGFQLQVDNASSSLVASLRDTSDRRIILQSATNSLQNGVWQQVAFTWDGSLTGGMQFYIDGAPVAGTTTSIGAFQGLDGGGLPVRIGGSFDNAEQVSRSFNGQIDCVSLWRGTLDQTQVSAVCAVPEPSAMSLLLPPFLVALYASRRRLTATISVHR